MVNTNRQHAHFAHPCLRTTLLEETANFLLAKSLAAGVDCDYGKSVLLLLYLLLPPLLHAVAHIRLEPEAQRDHRVPDAGIQTDNFNFPQNFQFT